MKIILILTLLINTNIALYGQCTAVGPNNANSFSNSLATSTPPWINNSNAQLSDDVYASAGQFVPSFYTTNSNYLIFLNPKFSIPGSAVICGIQFDVERSATGLLPGSSVTDNSIKILKGGEITGTEQASGSVWPSTDTYTTYGGNTDLWGKTWTADDINAPDFGFAISAKLSNGADSGFLTAQVDHIRATVYYTLLLPITLKHFNAKQISDKVKLEWVTTAEFNNKCFLVERSVNNYSWTTIDTLPGAGYSDIEKYYVAYDNFPGPVNYYRLKQIDFAGKVSMSKIITMKTSNISAPFAGVSPNPVSSLLTINSPEEIKDVHFFNTNSVEVFPAVYRTQRLSRVYDVKQLSPGIYFSRIYTGKGITTQKVIVQN
jgi:hypothetical protein